MAKQLKLQILNVSLFLLLLLQLLTGIRLWLVNLLGWEDYQTLNESAPDNRLRSGRARTRAYIYELVVGEVSVQILKMRPKNCVGVSSVIKNRSFGTIPM